MDYEFFIESDFSPSLSRRLSGKMATDHLPDVFVGENPIEINEVYLSATGKGYRTSYSQRPSNIINFNLGTDVVYPVQNKFHKHDYFELLLVGSERIIIQIESGLREFRKGDVCLLNRSSRHCEHFEGEMSLFYMNLTSDYLTDFFRLSDVNTKHFPILAKILNIWLLNSKTNVKDFVTFRFTNQSEMSPLLSIFSDMRSEFDGKKPGYRMFTLALLYRLFCVLGDPVYYETDYIDLGSDDGFSLAYSAKQILDKYKRKVTKDQIAVMLSYNFEYINRVFKKHYGYSIPEYNRHVCMVKAAEELKNSGKSIQQISKELDYVNRTNFYHLFRQEYACTPAQYRDKFS